MDMDTVLFGAYTVGTVLKYAGIGIGGIVVLAILIKLFGKSEPNEHVQAVECLGCGWQGQVSRYAGRCPQCNTPLGDRKAGR
jgi:hypothetical protein